MKKKKEKVELSDAAKVLCLEMHGLTKVALTTEQLESIAWKVFQ